MGSGKSYEKKVIEKEAKESHKQSLPDAPKHVTDEIFVNNWTILNDFWLTVIREKILNKWKSDGKRLHAFQVFL